LSATPLKKKTIARNYLSEKMAQALNIEASVVYMRFGETVKKGMKFQEQKVVK
jgi:hypothetical protein